jgi:hypothetical protein
MDRVDPSGPWPDPKNQGQPGQPHIRIGSMGDKGIDNRARQLSTPEAR